MNVDIRDAIATALEDIGDTISDLQVWSGLLANPDPPCIDVYPADPFHEDDPEAFGDDRASRWTVRARAGSNDPQGQQDLLLQLMDRRGVTSVKATLEADQTLGGLSDSLSVDGPTGYRLSDGGPLIAVLWTVLVYDKGPES